MKQNRDHIIYGTRAIIEAIKSGREIDKVFLKKGLRNSLVSELMPLLKEFQIPLQTVPVEKLDRISKKNHQGTIAFASLVSYQKIENIIPQLYEEGKNPLIIVLDKITDVGNFGAIARSAECAGAHAILIPERGSAQVNADAMKTSAGALNLIPICRSENLKTSIDYLKDSGLQIVAATEKADKEYYSADFTIPTVIIMGSEESGISNEYLKRSDVMLKIPILGEIESLNVSVSTALFLYEVVRQRKH